MSTADQTLHEQLDALSKAIRSTLKPWCHDSLIHILEMLSTGDGIDGTYYRRGAVRRWLKDQDQLWLHHENED